MKRAEILAKARGRLEQLPADWRWARYWHGTRRRERLLVTLAHRLPRKLKERVYIAVAVEALSKMPGDTVVPEVRMMDVLEVYSNGQRR